MPNYQVKTKVFRKETNEFIGNSTAVIEADDKEQARFFFRHHCIEMNTPKNLKIVGDLRTLKLEQESV